MRIKTIFSIALSLFLSPLAVSSEASSIEVFDDAVFQAVMQRQTTAFSTQIKDNTSAGDADCLHYIEAGLPLIEDGMPDMQTRECQIHALMNIARAPKEQAEDDRCQRLQRLGDNIEVGRFPSSLNPLLSLDGSSSRFIGDMNASLGLNAEPLRGCTGFSLDTPGWYRTFVLLAVADWNGDGRADYLLDFSETNSESLYQGGGLLVALSSGETRWQLVLPCQLGGGVSAGGRPDNGVFCPAKP